MLFYVRKTLEYTFKNVVKRYEEKKNFNETWQYLVNNLATKCVWGTIKRNWAMYVASQIIAIILTLRSLFILCLNSKSNIYRMQHLQWLFSHIAIVDI